MYPELAPGERETAYVKERKTAFVMQIGDVLKSGIRHDGEVQVSVWDEETLSGCDSAGIFLL